MFDEVDTGIGGRSADPVGRSLWALARRHQVLCVTHLPQIAAHADAHFRIAKRERDGRTVTEVERLDREGRIVELAQMLGSARRRAGRRPAGCASRAASCSTGPRPGAARSRRPADPAHRPTADDGADRPSSARSTTTSPTSHVERGLAPATIRAYRGDLADFAASRGTTRGLGPLAGRRRSATSRHGPGAGGASDPGLAPTSLRRRAAALKGFYRFAYGEGLIGVDVAAHLDLPRQSRLLPETLTVEEIERLLEAAGGDDPDEPTTTATCATARCSSCSTRPACGSARRSGSIARTSRSTAAFVRVIGKGDKERLVPVGDVALDWLGRWLDGPRPRLLALGHVAARRAADPCSSATAGSRLARQQAWARGQGRGALGGPRRPGQPAHAAPLVRDASARGRRRPAHRPGVARTCEYLHDPAVHASDRGADPGRLQLGPIRGPEREGHAR